MSKKQKISRKWKNHLKVCLGVADFFHFCTGAAGASIEYKCKLLSLYLLWFISKEQKRFEKIVFFFLRTEIVSELRRAVVVSFDRYALFSISTNFKSVDRQKDERTDGHT